MEVTDVGTALVPGQDSADPRHLRGEDPRRVRALVDRTEDASA